MSNLGTTAKPKMCFAKGNIVKTPFAWRCFIFSISCLSVTAQAAELDLEGSRLLVSGILDGSSVATFKDHLASGQVRTVVFENSLGGTPEVAAEYARAIQARGVNTEVKGQCQAACAFAFLAGKEHRFGRGFQVNALLIPFTGRPKPNDLTARWRGEDVYRALAEFTVSVKPASASGPTAGTPPAPIVLASSASGMADESGVNAMPPASGPKEPWTSNQGVLFTSTPTLFGAVHNSFYCDGTQGRDMSRCEVLSDADPYKLGVLTP